MSRSFFSQTSVVAVSDHAGAAKRRRERRLRSWLRHERMTVAMELASALHHEAPRGTDACELREKAAGRLEGARAASGVGTCGVPVLRGSLAGKCRRYRVPCSCAQPDPSTVRNNWVDTRLQFLRFWRIVLPRPVLGLPVRRRCLRSPSFVSVLASVRPPPRLHT